MNGFDALQQLVAEAASTRKMIEQIQASIGYKPMAQQLAEAASTRKMIEQIQASIGYKAMAQQLAEAASTRKMIEQIQASIGYKAVAQQLAEASSISRLLAAGLRGPGLLRSAEFRAATGIVTGDMTADIIEELPATDVDDTLRD